MKVLILTQNFPPEPNPASRMLEVGEYLVSGGHKVTVVTSFPNYPLGVVYEGYRGKFYQKEKINGVTVIRVYTYTSPKRLKFSPRILNYISFMITSILGMVAAGKHDVIYVWSPPLFSGFSASIAGKFLNAPFIFEVQDLWPKAPIFLKVIKSRFSIWLAERMEKFIYNKAAKIFAISHLMRQEIINTGVPPEKVEVHYNWIDTDVFQPQAETQHIREKYKLNDKFIVMFAGNMGIAQGLENVIECANILREKKDILFTFVGDGIKKEELIRMKDDYKLENVKFLSRQLKEKMPLFFSSADVLLVHLNKAPFRKTTIPSKICAYMSCGRPILTATEGESAEIIEKSRCGIAVEPENPQAMADAILKLYESDSELRAEFGKNARNYAVEFFDKRKLLNRLMNSLTEIVEGRYERGIVH